MAIKTIFTDRKYEIKLLKMDSTKKDIAKELNKWASQGWRLVGVAVISQYSIHYYLEKPL